jgi:hypothetical protein
MVFGVTALKVQVEHCPSEEFMFADEVRAWWSSWDQACIYSLIPCPKTFFLLFFVLMSGGWICRGQTVGCWRATGVRAKLCTRPRVMFMETRVRCLEQVPGDRPGMGMRLKSLTLEWEPISVQYLYSKRAEGAEYIIERVGHRGMTLPPVLARLNLFSR